jgi:hypothetical protein
MQCGYPGPGPVVVRFPTQERLPKTLPAGAVRANGSAEAAAIEPRNAVIVTLPPAPTVICDVIGPGRRLSSDGLHGSKTHSTPAPYTIAATRESTVLSSTFVIRGG